jgi:hypothetical protein
MCAYCHNVAIRAHNIYNFFGGPNSLAAAPIILESGVIQQDT